MNNTTVFFLCLLLGLCVAFRQEFTLYAEPAQQGDSFTLRNKQPNLQPHLSLLNGSFNSVCYKGLHWGYHDINYGGTPVYITNSWDNTSRCFNYSNVNLLSLRHLGPAESTAQSISLYQDTDHRGVEIVIDGAAFTNFPFRPRALFITGRSNWTLYSENNFSGTSSCFTSSAEYHLVPELNSTFIIGSVLRGCPTSRHIDNFIHATDLDIMKSQ